MGKVAEFSDMLGDLDIEWLSLEMVGILDEVAETGSSFKENASIKAQAYASASGMLTLADDSGLEVDALEGKPGVQTARYGGPGLSPRERYERLLADLREVPWAERQARFRCVIALADRNGILGTAEGICEGRIAFVPEGAGGFGYDPVFFLHQKNQTLAQLSPEEKHLISHRGMALKAIAPLLREIFTLK